MTLKHLKRVNMPSGTPLLMEMAESMPDVERRHMCRECGLEWHESMGGLEVLDLACFISWCRKKSTGEEIEWLEAVQLAMDIPVADLCDGCYKDWKTTNTETGKDGENADSNSA